jgi:hypothetical protein
VRDGGRCRLRLPGCTVIGTTADHIIPRSRGGRTTLENLRATCGQCNSTRGDGTNTDAQGRQSSVTSVTRVTGEAGRGSNPWRCRQRQGPHGLCSRAALDPEHHAPRQCARFQDVVQRLVKELGGGDQPLEIPAAITAASTAPNSDPRTRATSASPEPLVKLEDGPLGPVAGCRGRGGSPGPGAVH